MGWVHHLLDVVMAFSGAHNECGRADRQSMTTPLLDASAQTASQRGRTASTRLVRHAVALCIVLLALIPILGGNGLFSADEGAGVLQAKVLAETGQWRLPHPLPEVDPTGEHFSLHLSVGNEDGYVLISRKPAYTALLASAWKVAPSPMLLMALSAIGTVFAAVGSALLSRLVRPDIDVLVLWGVGLVSPLAFDSQLIIAHSVAAGFAAFAAVFLLRAAQGGSVLRSWLPAGLALAGLVMTRTEGIIAAVALCGALSLIGMVRKDRRELFVGLAGGVASSVAYLIDRALAAAVQGSVTVGVSGTNVSTPRTRNFDSQLEGLNRTWLWARSGGIAPADYLLVLAIALIGIALVLVRRPHHHDLAGRLAVVGAVLGVTKFLADPAVVIPGMIFAFPVMAFGVLTMRRSIASGVGAVLLVASAVFAVGVAATQYREGGSAEFGGRYFAVALPFIAPLLFAAIVDRLSTVSHAARQRLVVAVALVSITTICSGLLGLAGSQNHSADLVAAVDVTMNELADDTGLPAVVLTTQNPVGRFVWDQQDDGVILLVAADELDDFATRLERVGTNRFGLVTIDPEGDLAQLPGAAVVQDREAWPDSRWHVMVIDAS